MTANCIAGRVARSAMLWLSLLLGLSSLACAQQRTDLNLVIALDCSWSVSAVEYALQAKGLATAFRDPQIIKSISGGTHGRIGVAVIQWSVDGNQNLIVPWTLIAGQGDSQALAQRIALTQRQNLGMATSISGALSRSGELLDLAPFIPERQVIDVVADGENNHGPEVEPIRNALVERGVTINALAVLNEVGHLDTYLRDNVIGGPGSFVEPARDYKDFTRAIRKKLLREIRGLMLGSLR